MLIWRRKDYLQALKKLTIKKTIVTSVFFRQSKLTVHTQRQTDLHGHLYESVLSLAHTPHKQCPVLPVFFH